MRDVTRGNGTSNSSRSCDNDGAKIALVVQTVGSVVFDSPGTTPRRLTKPPPTNRRPREDVSDERTAS